MTKITFPDKLGNPESLKKYLQYFKSFSTNVTILGKVCSGRSTDCFIYNFAGEVISEKTQRSKDFTSNLRDFFT